jgi:hypothetical protein
MAGKPDQQNVKKMVAVAGVKKHPTQKSRRI